MDKQLKMKDYLLVGSMLFGILFGAGNLIFPVHMGQAAAGNWSSATIGFLFSAIGLPFLGLIAMALSKSKNVYQLATRVGHSYAFVFTVLLYLVIGPLFALPRLATTSFTIGFQAYIAPEHQVLGLALYSVLFYGLAYYLARYPGKLLTYVGKFLNPIFLLVLGALLLLVVLKPMGGMDHVAIQAPYDASPLLQGVLDGYKTLDALAALAFGVLVVRALQQLGVESSQQMMKGMIKAGLVVVILMVLIYTLLSYAGAASLGVFEISENGGIALAQIARYYLGQTGAILLAIIVFFGCLKTTVGLLTSFSEAFVELMPQVSYGKYLVGVAIVTALIANVGLTKIIQLSTPVLMFIYPLAIVLILLTLNEPVIGNNPYVYRWATYLTLVAALLDALNASPTFIKDFAPVSLLLAGAKVYLPGFAYGMGWLIPALIGVIMGLGRGRREQFFHQNR